MRRRQAITAFAVGLTFLGACSAEPPHGSSTSPGDTGVSMATTSGSTADAAESTGRVEDSTGSTESNGVTTNADETGSSDGGSHDDVAPEFALIDLNPTSATFEQPVSVRDHLEKVSGWYFTEAT